MNYMTPITAAVKDDGTNLEILKKELAENGYKACGMSVNLMLSDMADDGLDDEAVLYWKTLGMTNLPYSPADIIPDTEEVEG